MILLKVPVGYFPCTSPDPLPLKFSSNHIKMKIFASWLCLLGTRFSWTVLLASHAFWLLDVFFQWKVPAGSQERSGREGSGHWFPFPSSALIRGSFIPSQFLQGILFLLLQIWSLPGVTSPPLCPLRPLTLGSPTLFLLCPLTLVGLLKWYPTSSKSPQLRHPRRPCSPLRPWWMWDSSWKFQNQRRCI